MYIPTESQFSTGITFPEPFTKAAKSINETNTSLIVLSRQGFRMQPHFEGARLAVAEWV